MNKNTLSAVKEGSQRMRAAGVRGVLVGTAGLAMHGYAVEPPDVDFLVPLGRSRVGVDLGKVRADLPRRQGYQPPRPEPLEPLDTLEPLLPLPGRT